MIRLSAFSDEAGQGLSSQIEALKRNNLFLTELRSVDGKNVRELSLAEARRIAHTLQRNGIGLSALASPLGKARIDVDLNDYLLEVRRMCELAVVFATDRIRIFSFFDAYDQEERVFEYLNAMVEVAAEYGVSLCHENERNVFGDLSERVLTLWDRVKGLKCIYDFANYLQVGELPHDNMDKLYPITDFFHIKDMVWETGEIVPAGFGDGGISELIQRLDRPTVFTVEPHLRVCKGYGQTDGEEPHRRFHFTSRDEAFDAAVHAIKSLIRKHGYKEVEGGFERI